MRRPTTRPTMREEAGTMTPQECRPARCLRRAPGGAAAWQRRRPYSKRPRAVKVDKAPVHSGWPARWRRSAPG
eukprot:13912905-Alexandrium_andersonii.AAC.1